MGQEDSGEGGSIRAGGGKEKCESRKWNDNRKQEKQGNKKSRYDDKNTQSVLETYAV